MKRLERPDKPHRGEAAADLTIGTSHRDRSTSVKTLDVDSWPGFSFEVKKWVYSDLS